ncbi:nuclear transport factor 2 family protein [Collimonas pratensis]|uniref:nuclear transport factor 2 family protein n=1 Tax=Collimonas pratensis TaxID=279113 RepID=UPI00143D702C|nr:nuclear transport factor 2 family protein [Collimonas pratensis]NKI71157.1 nuclear transport factor 2 family protein [Collimonas pratensis]
MSFSVNELLQRNLHAIFGERDSAARMKELEAIWQPEGVFVDPDGRYVGLDAISHRVDELQARFPAFDFIERGPVDPMHGVGRLAWGYGPEDDRIAVTGVDIAVTRDGRLLALYAFVD